MNYRKLGTSFTIMLTSLSNFFGGHESQTVASFWQFMTMNVCERIADEHASFVFTIMKDRLFTDQAQLKKFQAELLFFNNIMWVLYVNDFEYCRFMATRSLRDVQWKVKRFCEASDNRIERALRRAMEFEQRTAMQQ